MKTGAHTHRYAPPVQDRASRGLKPRLADRQLPFIASISWLMRFTKLAGSSSVPPSASRA